MDDRLRCLVQALCYDLAASVLGNTQSLIIFLSTLPDLTACCIIYFFLSLPDNEDDGMICRLVTSAGDNPASISARAATFRFKSYCLRVAGAMIAIIE